MGGLNGDAILGEVIWVAISETTRAEWGYLRGYLNYVADCHSLIIKRLELNCC